MRSLRTASFLLVSCCLGSLACLGSPAVAQDSAWVVPQETLIGVVRQADGTAWVGAEVHVLGRRYFWADVPGDEFRKVVATDARGRFRIRVPADRDYSIFACSPEKHWRERADYRITDAIEHASGGGVLELQAQSQAYAVTQIDVTELEKLGGQLEFYLLGRTLNFDRMRLPYEPGKKLRLPPRPGSYVRLEVLRDQRPILSELVSRTRPKKGRDEGYTQRLAAPESVGFSFEVRDAKSGMAIPGATIEQLVYQDSYTESDLLESELSRYELLAPLQSKDGKSVTGEKGGLVGEIFQSRNTRRGTLPQFRVSAPGYRPVILRHSGRKLTDEVAELELADEEDPLHRYKVKLSFEPARRMLFTDAKGEPVPGIRVLLYGQERQQIGKNAYTNVQLVPQLLVADGEGRLTLPRFGPTKGKELELVVDETLGRAIGLDAKDWAALPACSYLHSGALWATAHERIIDLGAYRLLQGRVKRQNGLPVRGPLVLVEPSKRRVNWRGGNSGEPRGSRSGEYRKLLLPGSYLLAGFDEELGYFMEELEVKSGEGPIQKDFTLQPLRTVTGRVVDAAGEPLVGARLDQSGWSLSGADPADYLTARFNSRRPLAISGEDGRFRFGFIPSQKLRVRYRASYTPDNGRRATATARLEFSNEDQSGVEIMIPVEPPSKNTPAEKKAPAEKGPAKRERAK
jgi:hypothetical protein